MWFQSKEDAQACLPRAKTGKGVMKTIFSHVCIWLVTTLIQTAFNRLKSKNFLLL